MKIYPFTCLGLVGLLCFWSGAAASPVDGNNAYVARFLVKRGWTLHEACTVIGVVTGGRVSSVKKAKRDDKLCSLVPPGKQRLIVETITSSQSLFRTFGSRQIGITAQLRPGIMYEVKLERSGDRVAISIVESSSKKVVSEKLSFDISHPVLVPVPIPL